MYISHAEVYCSSPINWGGGDGGGLVSYISIKISGFQEKSAGIVQLGMPVWPPLDDIILRTV